MSTTVTTYTNNTSTKSFTCPVEGCGACVAENSRQIADHIKKSHPTISKKLGIDKNPSKRAFICKPCDAYTTIVHHHCFECEHPDLPGGGKSRYFTSAEARDEHLKSDHNKWWFEYECKFGLECRGKNGGCGFNHNHFELPYLTDTEDIPEYLCRNDRPWDGKRCLRDKCSYSHMWGRVRYLIKSRAATKSVSASTCCPCDSDCSTSVKTTENVHVVDA